ncbi:TPA: DUF416 family protein [Stenotrophomonas maltophilia]|nr:DUF416 family protein [Stenotrophomonas maltophilia]
MENYPATPSLASDFLLLSNWQRLAFMASCCERMIPNYRIFSAQTSFGDVNTLRYTLDSVWLEIRGVAGGRNLARLSKDCEAQAPDPSDFSSIYASSALDAATAISITASAAATQAEVTAVMDVVELARDSVDLFVQIVDDLDPNAPGFENEILRSLLMQTELKRQRRALEILRSAGIDSQMARAEIVKRWERMELPSLAATPEA